MKKRTIKIIAFSYCLLSLGVWVLVAQNPDPNSLQNHTGMYRDSTQHHRTMGRDSTHTKHTGTTGHTGHTGYTGPSGR